MANCEVQNLIYAIYGDILAMSATARTHKNKPDTPLVGHVMVSRFSAKQSPIYRAKLTRPEIAASQRTLLAMTYTTAWMQR